MLICESCAAPIPPGFHKAIAKNVCPACENPIISPERKALLDELTEVIGQMASDPGGLASWLLANFHIRKIEEGDLQPTEFYGKKSKKKRKSILDDEEPTVAVPGMKINSNNPLDRIVSKYQSTSKNYANIVEQINSGDEVELDSEEEFEENNEDYEEDDDFQSGKQNKSMIRAAIKNAGRNMITLPIESNANLNNLNSQFAPSGPDLLEALRIDREQRNQISLEGGGHPNAIRRA